jgi:hypothetical protein
MYPLPDGRSLSGVFDSKFRAIFIQDNIDGQIRELAIRLCKGVWPFSGPS